MRIIAGSARGRTITAPKGHNTRPTLDFVRESLFNIIQRDVPGAAVLDLFAGSGALALEALSRGADTAVLADTSRQAIECVRRNIEILGYSTRASVFQGDWRTIPARLAGKAYTFDLVFLDPPYDLVQYAEMTDSLYRHGLLKPDALVVIEHHKDVTPMVMQPFTMLDLRLYGDTAIHFYTFNAKGETNEQ
jgi:16S rRNA (guanine966-N2)-methyltransferase